MEDLVRKVAKRHMRSDDVPETVKEKAEELKEKQDYSDDIAFPIAWSIYCCENPDSPHCKQDEYFEGEPAICEGIGEN